MTTKTLTHSSTLLSLKPQSHLNNFRLKAISKAFSASFVTIDRTLYPRHPHRDLHAYHLATHETSIALRSYSTIVLSSWKSASKLQKLRSSIRQTCFQRNSCSLSTEPWPFPCSSASLTRMESEWHCLLSDATCMPKLPSAGQEPVLSLQTHFSRCCTDASLTYLVSTFSPFLDALSSLIVLSQEEKLSFYQRWLSSASATCYVVYHRTQPCCTFSAA
jgi:hypothetical protein